MCPSVTVGASALAFPIYDRSSLIGVIKSVASSTIIDLILVAVRIALLLYA